MDDVVFKIGKVISSLLEKLEGICYSIEKFVWI